MEGGRVLATLIRLTEDIDRAEDALQDAALAATEAWPRDGIPDNPGAWLTTVARNKAVDRLRREATRHQREYAASLLLSDRVAAAPAPPGDDRLRLLFTCCHPALSPESQVALTLRTICQLTTPEIASVFLQQETTIGQRISRAKKKISTAGIPYRVPSPDDLPRRLGPVLATVYAVFTAGHHAPRGRLDSRVELAEEAIRIGRLLVELMPEETECAGLLALMLATHARRAARVDPSGRAVLLADQDRTRWDRPLIEEASALIERALRHRRPGPYQLQAAIACVHGVATSYADTDWDEIVRLYDVLMRRWPSAPIQVNRAVAVGEQRGPAAGLSALNDVAADAVAHWHL